MKEKIKDNLLKTRRGIPAALLILLLVAGISIIGPAAALKFSANDVTISSDNGQIKSATISPQGQFSWEGVDVNVQFDGDDRVAYNIYVKLNDGDWGLLYSANQKQNIEDMGTTGHDKFVFKNIELKKPNVIAYWQLETDKDGTKNVSQIGVKINATLQTSNVVNGVTKWKDLVSASNIATFTFTCTNEEAVADMGGSINPNAEPTPDT